MEVDCWLVRIEWCPRGLLVCLPLVILPVTIKSRRSFLLALAHLGGPGKMAVEQLCCLYWVLNWSVCCCLHFTVAMFSCKNQSRRLTHSRKNEISTLASCATSRFSVRSTRTMEFQFCSRSWTFCMQPRSAAGMLEICSHCHIHWTLIITQ